jgi:hypothetical protein
VLSTNLSTPLFHLEETHTTINGKVVERVQGSVEQVNAKGTGIKLLGEWLNVSQYSPISVMPMPGELVDVQVERSECGSWIKSLTIQGRSASSTFSGQPAASRDRTGTRLAVLKAAASFLRLMGQAREEVRSDHLLVLADKWLAWVGGGRRRRTVLRGRPHAASRSYQGTT